MLKRLELAGFKSFCQKTILDFSKGITVIVGPNGSGKSNIVDALKWILGERDAKNLRGDKVENLIFSGTSQKTRLSAAQASICINNSSKALPIDFNEIDAARKIYRDGSSEYFINKSAVRLKDLVDLFAKSKLGSRGFSIISQGNADAFIKASPKERREMMEETLGLRQYQIKKHEARLKLANTKTNLEKVQTATNEILPHLNLLRRQTNKWQKRVVFENELKDLESKYFFFRLGNLDTSSQHIQPEIQKINQKINSLVKELHNLEKEVEKIENAKPKTLKSDDQKFNLQKELGRLEAEQQFVSSKQKFNISAPDLSAVLKDIQGLIKQILSFDSLEKVKNSLININEKINKALSPKRAEDNGGGKKEILARLEKIKEEIKKLDELERGERKQFEDFNSIFRKAFEAAAAKKNDIQQLTARKAQFVFEREKWDERREELNLQISQAGYRLDYFKDVQVDLSGFILDQAERRIARLKNELAIIGEIDESLVKEAKETEDRYQFLSSQLKDLESASINLGNLITELDLRVKTDFNKALRLANSELNKYFHLMFGEGKAQLAAADSGKEEEADPSVEAKNGIDINISLPRKGVKGLESLSGGEKSLTAIAVLFSLISISPPPFIVFDEVDATLDEKNSRRFADLLKGLSHKTQFIVVTHNRSVMEAADVLYGVTMGKDGVSKILSLKLT